MTLEMDGGTALEIDWMWGPLAGSGHVMMQYADGRALADIAAGLEGHAHMVRRSDTEGDMEFDGYTRLEALVRQPGGRVQATFSRPDTREGDGA